MTDGPQAPLRFFSQKALAQRLVLSTLTGQPVHISQIRPSSPLNPGLEPHEVSFLRLLESVTNGSVIEISYSGTALIYRPGLITGSAPGSGASGGVLRHELPARCVRGVSYFLIPLCLLAPFSKGPINVLLTGPGVITSATPSGDVSADTVRTAILPLYSYFGITNNIELRIIKRSNMGPKGQGGAGEVQLVFGHQLRLPKTIHLLKPGRVKKIRGVAYCTGVSASNNARMIEAARGVLNPMTADVYIYSDVTSAPLIPSNNSSNPNARSKIGVGFGLSLVAESSTGSLYSADIPSPPTGGYSPEDLGQQCVFQLLEAISTGGCASMIGASTILTLMAFGSEDIGRARIGKRIISDKQIVELGRDLRTFGLSGWGFREPATEQDDDIVVSVIGKGVANVGRKIS